VRLTEADRRPVISRASAETLGELKHVVVDVPSLRIAALHVAGGRRNARMVDWSSIHGFGPDGIVVEDEAATRPPADDRELAVAAGKLDLDGREVLSDGGDSLGRLTDIVFDEGSGRLVALATGDVEHDVARLRAIGPYCVILRAAPEASAPEA
jgi:uncharacterized protein YrrD